MCKRILSFVLIFLVFSSEIFCQTLPLNRDAEPLGGMMAMDRVFNRIRFNTSQLSILSSREISLVFRVDTAGNAALIEVIGVSDSVIMDSIAVAAESIPRFRPTLRAGKAIPSIYIFPMEWRIASSPALVPPVTVVQVPHALGLENIENIIFRSFRMDYFAVGVGNAYGGNVAGHLRPGGGVSIGALAVSHVGFGAGMVLNAYGNKLYTPYSLATSRPQFTYPATVMLGVVVRREMMHKPGVTLACDLELCMTVQSLTEKVTDPDPDWVQLRGFSPGVVLTLGKTLGKEVVGFSAGKTTLSRREVLFTAGVRPLLYALDAARGILIEVGVGLNLSSRGIIYYDEKLN